MTGHGDHRCYICQYDSRFKLQDMFDHVDEMCEAMYAEIAIMRTMRVRDFK